MARNAAIADLFGAVPQAPKPPATADASAGPAASDVAMPSRLRLLPMPPGGMSPAFARQQIAHMMDQATAAATMPWDASTIQLYTSMVPHLCGWLERDEGDRLLQQFKAEMDRLACPLDATAPNWRRHWGL